MEWVAIVEPSKGDEPGHMVIGQEADDGISRFFGFRFDAADSPADYQAPEQWQAFLFSNKILGSIDDDTGYVQRLRAAKSNVIVKKRVVCDLPLELHLPAPVLWNHCEFYSFRPDDFRSDAEPYYYCVTQRTKLQFGFLPANEFWSQSTER